jgi:hypothetical protein
MARTVDILTDRMVAPEIKTIPAGLTDEDGEFLG